MFIMSVCINGEIEDPRLFKTHDGALNAMFEILKGYAEQCCSYSSESVRDRVVKAYNTLKRGVDTVDDRVDGWIQVYVTNYGASICFPDVKPYGSFNYDGCEVSITNIDEIEVEE